jgi:hypothetical protein
MTIIDDKLSSFFDKVQQAIDDGNIVKKIGFSRNSYSAVLSPAPPKRRTLDDSIGWKRYPHLVPKEIALSPIRSYAYYYESRNGDFFPVIWLPKRIRQRHYTRRMYTGPDHGGMWFEKTEHNTKGKFDMDDYGITWRLWTDWREPWSRGKPNWECRETDNKELEDEEHGV